MTLMTSILCYKTFAYSTMAYIYTLLTLVQVLSVATKDEILHSEILYEKVTTLQILFTFSWLLGYPFGCFFCLP